jgi:hypothetical protein
MMKKDNKREIEILVERIKYLESIIQDNVTGINTEDLKEWSEEEVIHTIEDKDRIILHLKERIHNLEEDIKEDEDPDDDIKTENKDVSLPENKER